MDYVRRITGDWVTIDPSVAKTFLKIGEKFPCDEGQTLFNDQSITVKIFRKGVLTDTPLAIYNAFQIDQEGFVGFYWDDTFLSSPPGYYIGDFFY